MLTNLHIENYKSIHNLDIDLGRVNVFIGENGCGKSNILEALAFASAAKSNRLRNDDFEQMDFYSLPLRKKKGLTNACKYNQSLNDFVSSI